jgi:hypothetical protein
MQLCLRFNPQRDVPLPELNSVLSTVYRQVIFCTVPKSERVRRRRTSRNAITAVSDNVFSLSGLHPPPSLHSVSIHTEDANPS